MATIRRRWGSAAPALLTALLCGLLGMATGVRPALAQSASEIDGFVLNDVNGNHLPDRNDAPLASVTVTLKSASGAVVANTLTGFGGQFQFQGVAPGVYLVTQIPPLGFSNEELYPGNGGVKVDVTTMRVTVGGGLGTYSGTVFLDQPMAAPVPGPNQIAGSVFSDVNGNGVVDAGDAPLANVIVTLRNASNQPIATAVSSVTGGFSFSGLANGTYTLVQTVPAGYTSEAALAGTGGQVLDANTIQVTTASGIITYAGQAFLDRPGAVPVPGSNTISGFVLNDLNGNHVPDLGEPPLAGAVITLQSSGGLLLGTATSGADGSFAFSNLASGSYVLTQQAPFGFTGTAVIPGVGSQALGTTSIQVTTTAGLTNYPGQLFLDQAGGAVPLGQPAILGVAPASGGPGSTVILNGRSFGSGPVQVLFGSTPATVLSSNGLLNSVVALVPNLPVGPVAITLVNASGTSNPVSYAVTPAGADVALGPLFLPAFGALGAQAAQIGPTMQVVIAQSLSFAQNQAVGGDTIGAINTLRGLLARISRAPADVVSLSAKAALSSLLNGLIGQL